MNKKRCAECGKEIEESYYKVGDNFLQVRYFDDEEVENVFCSKDCLCSSLCVLEIYEDDEEEYEEITDDEEWEALWLKGYE